MVTGSLPPSLRRRQWWPRSNWRRKRGAAPLSETLEFRLDTVFQQLERAKALEELFAIATAIRDALPVSHVVYHWVNTSGQQYGCGTYDPAWAQRYQDREYLRVDPVIAACYGRFHPVDWRTLDWSGKPARMFLLDAKEHGVGHQGYSIPIRGPLGQFALFTVSDHRNDADWTAFTEENRRLLILLAHAFNAKALELEPGRTEPATAPLSPREVDSMTLLAMGYSRAQVAQTLHISEHTLRAYIESARLKLGAQNTLQAVARAMSRGMIVV